MTAPRTDILVYGAYGHTGRFVSAELRRREWRPVLAGRDPVKLAERHGRLADGDIRVADVGDPGALDHAARGCLAILNCAGPFVDTAPALIEAALRLKIPYLDTTGEPAAVAATFNTFSSRALDAGVVVMPATAFYGGLPDLLASAVIGDWQAVDSVSVAFALDEWKPTPGTRAVMQRMTGARPVFADGKLRETSEPPAYIQHDFPAPVGRQTVMTGYPGCESVLIPQHLATSNVHILMAVAALKDLRDPDAAGPVAVDASGRSAQTFLIHVEVAKGPETRSAWARGRDIYATTAPILVEAMERVLAGRANRTGVVSAGQVLEARDFLANLAGDGFEFALA